MSMIRASFPSFSDYVEIQLATPQSRILIVDAYAFLYWILADQTAPSYCADYGRLKLLITHWVARVRKYSIVPVFVLDGATPRRKLNKKLERLLKQAEDVHMYLNGESRTLHSLLPHLAHTCAIQVLKSLDVQVFVAEGEADSEIVNLAQQMGAFAILSGDTDFLVYDEISCGLVPHWALSFTDDEMFCCVHIIRFSMRKFY